MIRLAVYPPLSKFQTTARWLKGPIFLWDSDNKFFCAEPLEIHFDEDPEIKLVAATCNNISSVTSVCPMPDASQFSSWAKYRHTVAWMLRFANNFSVNHGCKHLHTKSGPLIDDEISYTVDNVIRKVQVEVYKKNLSVKK